MTVCELIDILKAEDPTAEVVINDCGVYSKLTVDVDGAGTVVVEASDED